MVRNKNEEEIKMKGITELLDDDFILRKKVRLEDIKYKTGVNDSECSSCYKEYCKIKGNSKHHFKKR